jgi:anti-sigma factor RsiW
MSITFTHDDKQTLIAYVYGEVDPPTRAAVEAHLAGCAACTEEVSALGGVRSELSLWVPPEVELDFTIVKKSELPGSNVLRPAQWWNTVPVWAQAAAAILVLGVGLAIANVQVKSGPEGFVVTTGWMTPTTVAPTAAPQADDAWKTALVSLEQQLRTEIRATRDQQATRVAAPAAPADEATLRRVRQLLADSELRQDRELALRFTQFTRDMTMQRRADMQRISAGFGEYDNRLMRQGQMINNVIRVSGTPQQ